MSAETIVKRLRAQRQVVVDLGDGLSVTLLRPREAEFAVFRTQPVADLVAGAAIDWSGFTEAFFFGTAVGNSDPLPFDAALWDEAARDRQAWLNQCITALSQAVTAHLETREAVEKN